MALLPAGFISLLCDWFVTEVGRQPYLVYAAITSSAAKAPMKSLTDTQKQWAWFITLWLTGLLSMALLGLIFRWVMRW